LPNDLRALGYNVTEIGMAREFYCTRSSHFARGIRSQVWLYPTIKASRKRPNKRSKGDRQSKTSVSTNSMRVGKMKFHDFESMSADELWSLHERVTSVLARRISAEKGRLEQRLRQLGQGVLTSDEHVSRARRHEPKAVEWFKRVLVRLAFQGL
jgi:hypothetical protein